MSEERFQGVLSTDALTSALQGLAPILGIGGLASLIGLGQRVQVQVPACDPCMTPAMLSQVPQLHLLLLRLQQVPLP